MIAKGSSTSVLEPLLYNGEGSLALEVAEGSGERIKEVLGAETLHRVTPYVEVACHAPEVQSDQEGRVAVVAPCK